VNKAIKDKWVTVLKSGEYNQICGMLHTSLGFCVTGVLCDLYIKEKNDPNIRWERDANYKENCLANSYFNVHDMYVALPKEVKDWAELQTTVLNTEKYHTSLIELNDSGQTFHQIADIIDSEL